VLLDLLILLSVLFPRVLYGVEGGAGRGRKAYGGLQPAEITAESVVLVQEM
jgi:hypothetical protein